MKLRTFVRYDGKNKMVRGSAILAKKAPDVGNWEEILFETDYSSSSREHGMLAYIAYDRHNNFLSASNILVRNKPKTGRWKQINVLRNSGSVTTTSTSSTTTTTTTNPPEGYFATFRADENNTQVNLAFGYLLEPTDMTVDWGDGNIEIFEPILSKFEDFTIAPSHDYLEYGDYEIIINAGLLNVFMFTANQSAGIISLNHTAMPSLQYLDLSFTSITNLINISELISLQVLDVSQTDITTTPILTGLTALQNLWLDHTAISVAPNLTGLVALVDLDLNLTSVDADDVLSQFSVLFEYCTAVNLENCGIPTPAILLTAQIANPQCTFNVDYIDYAEYTPNGEITDINSIIPDGLDAYLSWDGGNSRFVITNESITKFGFNDDVSVFDATLTEGSWIFTPS